MKNNLLLLGMAAVLVTPVFSLRADDAVNGKKTVRKAHVKQATMAAHPNRETFYITNHTVTGSHIPVVVTRYRGNNITSSPVVTYDQTDISSTGALDVGSALVARDPSITFARTR